VSVPFTIEQFLGVFVVYNAAIWPLQIIGYGFGGGAVAALWLHGLRSGKLILTILALMWAVNGIGYHFIFFSTINPAAKLFALVFVLQAILLAAAAVAAPDFSFRCSRDWRSVGGVSAMIYAMLIYPVLGIVAGHGLMAGPMFGVAPCPTTIFTIGMLMLARGRWVKWLAIIPLLWSLVGLAAALQLGIPEDFGLPVAGLFLLIVLVHDAVRGRLKLKVAARDPRAAGS
jgi:Family of unknown function (DUF6064)